MSASVRAGRRVAAVVLAATTVILTSCSSQSGPKAGDSQPIEHVKLALSFAPNGLLAGLVSAIDRGTFTSAGLDIELVQPTTTADSLKLLGGKGSDISLASALDQILAKSRGVNLTSVATTLQDTGSGVMTRADSGIKSLKQLEGHTVGMSGQVGPRAVFEDLLRRNGVDVSKIRFVIVGFTGGQMLASKRVDALGDQVSYQIPSYNAAIGRPLDDKTSVWFASYAELGAVKFYAATLNVLQDYLAAHGDLVRHFLAAWRTGNQWAIENPDAAAALEVKHFPELKLGVVTAQWKQVIKLIQSTDTATNGLGWQNPAVFDGMSSFLAEHKIAPSKVESSTVMTNDYLPKGSK